MTSKYVITVVLTAVFAWSVAMAALGQAAAVGALVPPLVLLVQQVVQVLSGGGIGRAEPSRPAGPDEGDSAGPLTAATAGGGGPGELSCAASPPALPAAAPGEGRAAGEESCR